MKKGSSKFENSLLPPEVGKAKQNKKTGGRHPLQSRPIYSGGRGQLPPRNSQSKAFQKSSEVTEILKLSNNINKCQKMSPKQIKRTHQWVIKGQA